MSDIETSETRPAPQRSLWRNADFMLLWSGQVVSTLGTSASTVVYPLLVLALTNSPAAAGVAGALWLLPYLFLSLPVGALIDRWDRKQVMILADIGRALTLGSIPIALAFDVLTIWQIYAAQLIEGIFYVFFNIAQVAALPRVVPKAQLPEAAAQNEAAFAVAGIAGPSVGTVMYQNLGRAAPFVVDSVSFAASVVSLLFIKTKFQATRAPAPHSLRAEIGQGLAWLWGQPLIRYLAFLTGGFNFVFAASNLVIIVLAKDLGLSDAVIGTIFSIGAAGGILGSLIGGQVQKRFSFGVAIMGIAWFNTFLFPLYAIAPNVLVLGLLTALTLGTGPIYNVVQSSYRLALIPDEFQGRVNSSFRLIAYGFHPLGTLLSGILLEKLGAIVAVLFLSVWLLVLALVTTLNRHVQKAPPIDTLQST